MSLVNTPEFSTGFWIAAGVVAAFLIFGLLSGFVRKVV